MKHLALGLPAFAAMLACPAAAMAEDGEANLTASQALTLAEAYQNEGRDKDADALLDALTHDRNVRVRAEAHFRLGQARMDRGDIAGAIDAFEAVLEEQPDAQPVRLALARALAMQGRRSAAARELRRAESGGLPEDVQRLVDRFSDMLRRSRPYGLSVELGLAPDSNINQATNSSTIEIAGLPLSLDDSGRETSGVGLTGTVDAFATLPLGHGVKLANQLSAAGNFYRRGKYDDIFVQASSGPEFALGRVVARAAATYAWRKVGDRRYSSGLGGSIQLLAPAGEGRQLAVALSVSDQDYRIAEQSGLQFAASLALEQAITPRLYSRMDVTAARAEAEVPAYATTSHGGSILLSLDTGPVTLFARGSYTRTDGDGPFALFGAARADNRFDLSVGASWKRFAIAGLSPVVRLQQTFNSSPLELYSFKRTRVEFALTERF